MNFEEVKQLALESIDEANNTNELIQIIIDKIYQKGFNDANLKQEGKPLTLRDDGYYVCPKCHNLISSGSNYCALCGQKILGC